MSRYDYLKQIGTTDGITIYNLNIPWRSFPFVQGYTPHVLTDQEAINPYLISYKYYSTTELDDIILLINGIEDPFNIQRGLTLKIPNKNELISWLQTLSTTY